MAYTNIKASAPGSMMLFGEHAVLADFKAIAMAINQRIQVSISTRADNVIHINSDKFHGYITDLDNLEAVEPYQFVLQTLQFYQENLSVGLDINISSQMSPTMGFGTSAAVTVACVAALEYLLFQRHDKHLIFLNSRDIIQATQGRGSGTDALASTIGGVVSYVMSPLDYSVYEVNLPISLIYCGYKTPTTEVIKVVDDLYQRDPEKVMEIFRAMDRICGEVEKVLPSPALRAPSPASGRGNHSPSLPFTGEGLGERVLPHLGVLMTQHHQYQKQLSVSDDTIEKIITDCQKHPIHGAKISGSGLGDCVAVLGDVKPLNPIQVRTDLQGVTIDTN